jgi:uncharacterized protein YjbI with pentapeptide repeats
MSGDKLAIGAVAALAALSTLKRRGSRNKFSQIRDMIDRSSETPFAADTILQAFELAESLDIPRYKINLSKLSFGNADREDDGYFMTLQGQNFCGIRFDGSFFEEPDFSRSNFSGASLVDVEMWGANMHEVNFSGANLRGAKFFSYGSSFRGASFCGAKTDGMRIVHSDLSGADFSGAAGLAHAKIVECKWNKDTIWPPGFKPRS